MKRATISQSLPTSANAGRRVVANAHPKGSADCMWRGDLSISWPARRGAQQQVTLPPFAEFWQANQLIEMPEEPENARLPASPPSAPIPRPTR